MKTIRITLMAIFLSVLFTGCTTDLYEPIVPTDDTQETIDGNNDSSGDPGNNSGNSNSEGKITYYGNVKSILNQLCISCHGPIDPKDHFDISTYEKAKKEIDEIIEEIQEDGDDIMPPSGRMAENLIQIIKDWETDGLLEGDPNSGNDNGNTSGNYSYVADIKLILDQECTACHGATSPAAGFDISSYAKTTNNIDLIITRIDLQNGQNGIMPTSGRMAEIKIQKIKDWKAQGMNEQ